MNYDPAEVLAAQDYFGFARSAPIEKDWHVVRAMRAIVSIEAAPFQIVFAGGTCLARAHKLVQRMSEDVDFKIVSAATEAVSANQRRKQLGVLRDRVTASLQAAGFEFDPANSEHLRSRDGNRYTVFQLPYPAQDEGLRSSIQVELNYSILRKPTVILPIVSFVSEAFSRPAEIETMTCVSVVETAAEKFVSLTRRIAMELAGAARVPDPTLVRHIYDLHMTKSHYDVTQVIGLAREIMPLDAEEFANQFPAYREDPIKETRRALAALETQPQFAQRYAEFLQLIVYGEKPAYTDALDTIISIVKRL